MIQVLCQANNIEYIKALFELEQQHQEKMKTFELPMEEKLKCNYCSNEINKKNSKSFNIVLDYKNYKIACLNCNKKISKCNKK